MIDSVKKFLQIKINHPPIAFGNVGLRQRHGLMRRALRTESVTEFRERDEFLEPLQAQSEEVTASGGGAQILEVEARDKLQEMEFRQLFDRTPDYEKLMREIRGARKGIVKTGAAVLSSCLTRFWRDFETVAQPSSSVRLGSR